MKKFNFNRPDAIEHIKKQNEYNAYNSITAEEPDKMAAKKKR